jgi:diaminopimelate epimerase
MRFTKMHGAGNDYVYVNTFRDRLPAAPEAVARAVADRHFGVGGDGLVLIGPSDLEGVDARMRMFNADGSEGEMCGNAIRCVGKLVHDRGIAVKDRLVIETGRGPLRLDLEIDAAGVARRARVNMGEPILDPPSIPILLPGSRVVDAPLPDFGPDFAGDWRTEAGLFGGMTGVSMGNPHVVLHCRDVTRVPLERIGPMIETASVFPRKINVHFAQVIAPDEVIMRTWERGSGITLACGTGASAVTVAGVLTGRSGRRVRMHLPGGDLDMEWDEATNAVFMTGPATEVFSGEINDDWLRAALA